MANLSKLQKKRNSLFLTPKRRLTSVIKPTTVDTTSVASTAPVVGGTAPVTGGSTPVTGGSSTATTTSPINTTPSTTNTSAGSGTSVISPTITNTPTTGLPAAVTPTAPKTNTLTNTLTNAAIVGGTALAGKYIYDKFGNIVKEAIKPTTPAVKPPVTSVVKPPTTPVTKPPTAPVVKPPVTPAVKPPVAPVVKPPTSVVIPPKLQNEQDALVKAANTAKEAAANDALANSFKDQGEKVGLPSNTIPNSANPNGGSTIDESMFDDPLDQGEKLGLEENIIPNTANPIGDSTIDDSMFDFDQGTNVDLDYNTIPNTANPNGGSTIDQSMFDDPYGVGSGQDVIPSAGSEIGPNKVPYDEDSKYEYKNATADQLAQSNQFDDPLGALTVNERYTDIDKNYADQFKTPPTNSSVPFDLDDPNDPMNAYRPKEDSLPIEFENVDLDNPNDPLNSFKPDNAVAPVQGGLGQTQADVLKTIQDTPVSEPAPLSDTASKIGIFSNPVYPESPKEPTPVATEPSAEPVLVQDETGNFFLANADGSYSPADAGGNAVGEPIFMGGNEDAGTGTEYADSGYGDTALDTAGGGYDAYDDAGNLFHVGDDGSTTLLQPANEEANLNNETSGYAPEPTENNDTSNYENPSAGYQAYDDAGNLYFVGDDGSFTLLEPAPEEPVNEEPSAGYDPNAGYEAYDNEGNLYFVGDDGSFTLLEPAYEEPAYEEPVYEAPTYEDPYSGYEDPYMYEEPNFGYDFNYDPSYYEEPPAYIEPDLSYLDDPSYYEDPNLGYYEEPYFDNYEPDLSYLDDYKRGGQVQKMKRGGLPHFEYGGGAYNSADQDGFKAESFAIPKNETAYANSQADFNFDMGYTPSSPASIGDMEYLYNDVEPNNETSAYYTPVNNDTSAYYTSTNPNMEENVFNPYDLHANEDLVEDPEGRKFAHDNNTGYYRLLEDSKFPTNSSPTKPTPIATPKSNFDFNDIFSADNIKTLAGAGLGAAGLMSLYNSFKDKEPNSYKPAVYTPPAIPPRTTDFGMGPARTVTPQMGGLQTMTPSQQENLYTNLGVAGYEQEHEDPVEDAVADQPMADGGYAQPQQPQPTSPSYFTYGVPQDPLEVLGVRQPQEKSQGGGLQMRQGGLPHPTAGVPIIQGRQDYRQGAAVNGEGDGQSDNIPAMLADGEYVFDSDVVAALGNGSNKAGAKVLDKFRESIRAHKRSAPIGKIPPKAKSPLAYLKEAK